MEHCDSEKVVSFVEWRSPFDPDPSLRNIVGSITSRPEVDHAKKIRVAILHTLVGRILHTLVGRILSRGKPKL